MGWRTPLVIYLKKESARMTRREKEKNRIENGRGTVERGHAKQENPLLLFQGIQVWKFQDDSDGVQLKASWQRKKMGQRKSLSWRGKHLCRGES